LSDLEDSTVQSSRGGDAWELVQAAISIKTAEATQRFARIASASSVASVVVALGALVVAIAKGGESD
jgi:hypothetical protein